MNSDLFSLLLQQEDTERYLMYIIKNAAYDSRCQQVADSHYKDMLTAIANCRRVIDQVLTMQHDTCN